MVRLLTMFLSTLLVVYAISLAWLGVGLDPEAGWPEALDAYYAEHETMGTAGGARAASLVQISENDPDAGPGFWSVRQVIDDPAGDHDWGIHATVDLAQSAERGEAVVRVEGLKRL